MSCNSPFQSTDCMCGTFTEPTNPDLGQCAPLRVKIDCEQPVVPEYPCDDPNVTIVSDPDKVPPFRMIATVFDTNCEPILDTLNNPITGPLY